MKARTALLIGLALLLIPLFHLEAQIPGTLSYQAFLSDSLGVPKANGTYTFTFRLYDAGTGGTALWTETKDLDTEQGLFYTHLGDHTPFPASLRFDQPYWLGIQVGEELELTPRIPLTSVGYSFMALRSDSAQYALLADSAQHAVLADTAKVATSALAATDLADNAVTSAKILDGTIQSGDVAASFTAPYADTSHYADTSDYALAAPPGVAGWSLTGNGITTADFLGTTNNLALELRVNSARALRLEPNATSPNVVGGYSGNSVTGGVYGATISGGGSSGYVNQVTDNYGTVGGGHGNQAGDNAGTAGHYATVAGGLNNIASGSISTVAGGHDNTASNSYATVGGGYYNNASLPFATIGGGQSNTASGWYATVSGGNANTASHHYATVPGGLDNTASGQYSFAAGRRAKAVHNGVFVWADGTDADFASTAADQFLIRAAGGVGIGTNNPQAALDVNGTVHVGGLFTTDGGHIVKVVIDSSGSYTATTSDRIILCKDVGSGETVNLPPAADAAGLVLTIKNISDEMSVYIAPDGIEKVDGASGEPMELWAMDYMTFVCDGTAWWIISRSMGF